MRYHHKRPATANKFMNSLMWVIAILAPFSTLPQIIEIFSSKSAAGVSLATWILFFISPLIWFTYGMTRKDKFIIVNNFLWATMSAIVLVGFYTYR